LVSSNRGDIRDEAGLLCFLHRLRKQIRELGQSDGVELKRLEVLIDLNVEEGSEGTNAGIVHEDGDGDWALLSRLKDALRSARFGEVRRKNLHAHPVCGLKFVRELLKAIHPASDKEKIRAERCQLSSVLLANPARGPRDDGAMGDERTAGG
jgi:hypothetical protein